MGKTLPARYYLDPQLFERELESFFFGRWVAAGRMEQIANTGDYFLREICGESIIVVRAAPESIRAYYNVCRHRGTQLCSEAEGNFARRIQCPYHGWTYGLDGSLLGAPHMDPATFNREDYPLTNIAAEVWDGHIFVNLSKKPKSLSRQLRDLPQKFAAWGMADLKLGRRIVYEVHANWKLLVSNFNECLHCPKVHPALDRLTDYLGADNEAPNPDYIGGAMGFKDGMETMTMDGQRHRDYLPDLDAHQRAQVCYYVVYPNFMLSLHPDYMVTYTLWPRAVDHTQIVCEFHFHLRELAKEDFYCEDAIEFWDLTNRQDWKIVEASQAGIRSRGYQPGPYSYREELLSAFDQEVVKATVSMIPASRTDPESSNQ
jgi:Rieske 2Fe-2S family protein